MSISYNISCVMVVPAELKDVGNMLGQVMGYGPDTYTTALVKAEDPEVITHYVSHSWVRADFVELLQLGKDGHFPQKLTAQGFIEEQLNQFLLFLNSIILSCRNYGDEVSHFNEVLTANGLLRYGFS